MDVDYVAADYATYRDDFPISSKTHCHEERSSPNKDEDDDDHHDFYIDPDEEENVR